MSKTVLKAKNRDLIGSSESKKVREQGFVPGVLYGGHMKSQAIMFQKSEIDKLVSENNPGAKIYLDLDGKEIMTLLKEVQKNVYGNVTMNVDLQALTMGEKVKLHVRLHYTGKEDLSPEVLPQELLHELEIETLPEYLIDSINVNVAGMELGDVIKVSDLLIMKDEHIKVLTDTDVVIFNLMSRVNVETVDEDAAEVEAIEPEIVE